MFFFPNFFNAASFKKLTQNAQTGHQGDFRKIRR